MLFMKINNNYIIRIFFCDVLSHCAIFGPSAFECQVNLLTAVNIKTYLPNFWRVLVRLWVWLWLWHQPFIPRNKPPVILYFAYFLSSMSSVLSRKFTYREMCELTYSFCPEWKWFLTLHLTPEKENAFEHGISRCWWQLCKAFNCGILYSHLCP